MIGMKQLSVQVIFFDFGGVIAEEGYRNGLYAIAEDNGLDPKDFAYIARALLHTTGYILGKSDEAFYWQALRKQTGIQGSDQQLRQHILTRFILRGWMMDLIDELKSKARLAILSDQTNWLDELDVQYGLSRHFEHIFNSFHMRKSKNDASLFDDVLKIMQIEPEAALFVDDTLGHIQRAQGRGLHAIHFTDRFTFIEQLRIYCSF
ncbi:MAG: HAD family phosphatase [Deltaproteobacteria bacterium]|nr:HAD family phosphatase [Deltaproteobacteria bacterium]